MEWIDSAGRSGWEKFEPEPYSTCRTAGYLMEKTDKQLAIAHSLDDGSGHINGLITIPRVAVRRVRRLR